MNPFDHQKAYGTMKLGPHQVPGVIQDIDGADREFVWEVKKPVSTGGADADFKGAKLAEGIKVKSELVTAADFLALEKFRKSVTPPKGQKPSAFDVTNAILTNNGIARVTIKKVGQEKWEGGRWTFTLELLEHDPAKKTAVGAVGSSKSSTASSGKPGSPGYVEPVQSAADKQIEALLAKAKAA